MAYHERDIRSVMPAPLRAATANHANPFANVTPLNAPQARSQAQIVAECEARYAEMQREAAKPERQFPCYTCVHGGGTRCRNPLIIGVERKSVAVWDQTHPLDARLCGPEKALWEPQQSWWQRLIDWVLEWFA
jgi:hypothetical protein